MKPFRRRYKKDYSFQLIFEGFFTEVFVPSLNYKSRKKQGVIDASKTSLSMLKVPIFSIAEIADVLYKGYGKAHSGQHTLKEADWGKSQ
jgi:hypothetical protein